MESNNKALSPLVGSIRLVTPLAPTSVIKSNKRHQYHRGLELEGYSLKELVHETYLQHTLGALENDWQEAEHILFFVVCREEIQCMVLITVMLFSLLPESLGYMNNIHVVI